MTQRRAFFEVFVHVGVFGELVFGVEACFDAHGEVDFLLCVEQGDFANLLEVVLDGVGGCAGGDDALCGCVVVVVCGEDEAGTLGCYFFRGLLFFFFGYGFFVFFVGFVFGVGGFEFFVESEVEFVVVVLFAAAAGLALGCGFGGGFTGALGLVCLGFDSSFGTGFGGCAGGVFGCCCGFGGCLLGAGGLGGGFCDGFFGCVAGRGLLAGCRCH